MPFPSMRSLQASQNAGPIALMLTLGLIHRSVRTRGFTLRGSLLSTDNVIMMVLFFIVNVWTLLVSLPEFASLSQIPSTEVLTAPWIALIFSYFWFATFLYTRWHANRGEDLTEQVGWWRMNTANGPFGWRESLGQSSRYILFSTTAIVQLSYSIAAIFQGDLIQGILSVAALFLYLSSAFPHNKYSLAPHRYTGDMLRIALPTSHIEGTVYVLPSRHHGFSAVWSPKIAAEHIQTDAEIMALFELMRTGRYSVSEPLRRLRTTMSAFNERVILADSDIKDLAEWLLQSTDSAISKNPLNAKRPPKVQLIGRDLMYALAHAEYLIFMRKNVLDPDLRKLLGKIRETKRSGGLEAPQDSVPTIGYQAGIQGYQEAVRYVYALFNEPLDDTAVNPPPMAPHDSVALGRRTTSTEDYVSSLWTLCLDHSESTFSALYMFCCVWFIEVGNVGGFHIFPLRSASQRGDVVAWQVIWRQGWYECLMAQLIASSPLLAVGFIVGVFQ